MKTKHDRDCTIYVDLKKVDLPEAGICTCGYGRQFIKQNDGDGSEMYSRQFLNELESKIDKDVFITNRTEITVMGDEKRKYINLENPVIQEEDNS